MAKHKRKAPEYIGSDFEGDTKYYRDGNAIFSYSPYIGLEYRVVDDTGIPGPTYWPDRYTYEDDELDLLLDYHYNNEKYRRTTADDDGKELPLDAKPILPDFEYRGEAGRELIADNAGNRAFWGEKGLFADIDPKTKRLGPFYTPGYSENVRNPLEVKLNGGSTAMLSYNPFLKEYELSSPDLGRFNFAKDRGVRWRSQGWEHPFDTGEELPTGVLTRILNLFRDKKYRRFSSAPLKELYDSGRMPLWEVNEDGNITDIKTGSRYGMKDGRLVKLSHYCKSVQYKRRRFK